MKLGSAYVFSLLSMSLVWATGAYAQFAGPIITEPSGPAPQIPITPKPDIPVFIPQTPPRIDIPVNTPAQPVLPLIPTDLTQPFENPEAPRVREKADALRGLEVLADSNLPPEDPSMKPEGIIVKFRPGSRFSRPSSCSVKLEEGDILVSVRRPTKLALLEAKLASASFSADSDVELKYSEGTLRLINLSGLGQKVLVKIADGILGEGRPRTFSIKAGYELVVADHRLHRAELRPADGYARRFFKTLENGQIAISEISVESVLKASDLVAELQQNDSHSKERRIMADMSKMAAVLNYVNGTIGFDSESKASLEVKSQIKNQDN